MKEYAFPQHSDQVRAILAGCRTQARLVVPRRGGIGQPGDRLWVKEAWRPTRDTTFMTPKALRKLRGELVNYRADWAITNDAFVAPHFMPRWASRITLEITEARRERLQAITEDDACAEGLPRNWDDRPGFVGSEHGWLTSAGVQHIAKHPEDDCDDGGMVPGGRAYVFEARECFRLWWDHRHGKRAPWASNPDVVVFTFRVLP